MENICSICFKKFTAKKNLMKHLRDVHKNFKEAERMVVKKIKCPEKNCDFICRMMKELRNHIEGSHKIKILKDTLQFPDESLFQAWKKEEEINTVSWFVTGRKKTTLIDGTKKQTLCCHRTGHYSPKGFGKYRMRSVGSCKIGVTCPAAMEVTESSDGQITINYYKTHLGHMQDVAHLKLTKEERAYLAEKIEQGFTFDSILEDVKESIDSNNLKTKRIHLLCKKDLYSIMRSLNNNEKKIENINGKKNLAKFVVEDKEEVPQDYVTENLKLGNSEKSVEENFTIYPGQSVIFPQEFNNSLMKFPKNSTSIQNLSDGISSQIVILARDIDYDSVAEIILLSAEETITQNGTIPEGRISNVDDSRNTPEACKVSMGEKSKIKRINLQVQLKEKMGRISELLPQSEFLTPKQFDLINKKLDAILNIFNLADVKAKANAKSKRKNNKKVGSISKKLHESNIRGNAIENKTNFYNICTGYG